MTFEALQEMDANDAPPPVRVSPVSAPAKLAGRISTRVFDPYKARREFPDRWAAWCREHFRDSVMLAYAFGVSEKTARLWMEGVTSPQGWVVDAAKDGCVDNVPPFGSEGA